MVPNRGILPEGIYFPRSEDPSTPARSHDVGGRPSDFRYFMEIPKTDGRECLHGDERPILTGGEEKDCDSYGLEEFCLGTLVDCLRHLYLQGRDMCQRCY